MQIYKIEYSVIVSTELKRRSTKLSIKPQNLMLPKKMERPCAWPIVMMMSQYNIKSSRIDQLKV